MPIYYVGNSFYEPLFKASSTDYTVVSFPLGTYPLTDFESGQVDVQVMAYVGYQGSGAAVGIYNFRGLSSSWSDIQTINIGGQSNVSPTPTIPEYPIAILPLLITAFLVAIIKANKKLKLAS